ncbi:MAG: septum formation protein Maf [Bacteroidales bacterium]|nr:septum formation protein Maf [Bacteroidales bacterium]
MKLLLASQSPRRRQLIGEVGFPVEFVSIDVEEKVPEGTSASDIAEALARLKSTACPDELLGEDVVLVTADTVVVLGDKVLGKPADRTMALEMLRALSGRGHTVYTGVCLRRGRRVLSFTEATEVHFRHMEEEELVYYVDRFRPYDKAGAYGIQEWIGMVGISRIEGCFYNVMGLPVARVYEGVRQLCPDWHPVADAIS